MRVFDEALRNGAPIGYNGPADEAYCQQFAEHLGGGYTNAVSSGTAAVFVAVRGASMALIEDCAETAGANLGARLVGTFADVAAFSTMYTKHINTGGQGGPVFTDDEATYWRVRQHADRGKPFGSHGAGTGTTTGVSTAGKCQAGAHDPAIGNVVAALNLNSDGLHAAIGRAQLANLPARIAARRAAAHRITSQVGAATDGLVSAPQHLHLPGAEPSYWFVRLHPISPGRTAASTTSAGHCLPRAFPCSTTRRCRTRCRGSPSASGDSNVHGQARRSPGTSGCR
jgi:dTDP-4-amino-4,6-dideoxygalactose transaminase